LGDPVVAAGETPERGDRSTKPRAHGRSARTPWERTSGAHERYRRARGTEAWREGRQGVGAPHSTEEAGEPTWRDPVEGRRRRITEFPEGKMADATESEPISTGQRKIA